MAIASKPVKVIHKRLFVFIGAYLALFFTLFFVPIALRGRHRCADFIIIFQMAAASFIITCTMVVVEAASVLYQHRADTGMGAITSSFDLKHIFSDGFRELLSYGFCGFRQLLSYGFRALVIGPAPPPGPDPSGPDPSGPAPSGPATLVPAPPIPAPRGQPRQQVAHLGQVQAVEDVEP